MMTLDTAYDTWIRERVTRWVTHNRPAYQELRVRVWASIRPPLQADLPSRDSALGRMLDGAVVEAIRKAQGWPSERSYEAGTRLPMGDT